jgi:hypothetical protein
MSLLLEDPTPGTLTWCWRTLGCGHQGDQTYVEQGLEDKADWVDEC